MKKVLSLVLAAAMVMGMSVSAFAANFSKPANSDGPEKCVNDFSWGNAVLVDEDGYYVESAKQGGEELGEIVEFENIVEGDAIYFEILENGKGSTETIVNGKHDDDCVLFEVSNEMKFLLKLTKLDWDGDITVGEFLEAVELAATNEDVKAEIKAVVEYLGLTEVSEVLNYGAIVGAGLAALEADLHEYCDTDVTVTVKTESGLYEGKVPSNWVLKIENSEYIEDAEIVSVSAKEAAKANLEAGAVYVKVILNDDFKAQDEEEAGEVLKFFMYIWDGEHASDKAEVHYTFKEYYEVEVTKAMAKHVIPVAEDTYYKLAKGINSLEVVFSLDNDVYVTAKMWKGEKYMVKSGVNAAWSKDLSKEYDTDIEVLTIESNLDIREVLWESKKDDKQVVELVDGALVAVDSEYVTKYEVIDGIVLAKGYIAETEEGSYALIDADIELIEKAPEVEADKANPSTGASDFVGAAVAMAVVSVAAAGALALKK